MSKTTWQQREDAKLHATAWEDAASSLSDSINNDPMRVERIMGVPLDQLKTAMWLAYAVGGGYRKIVNGGDLED